MINSLPGSGGMPAASAASAPSSPHTRCVLCVCGISIASKPCLQVLLGIKTIQYEAIIGCNADLEPPNNSTFSRWSAVMAGLRARQLRLVDHVRAFQSLVVCAAVERPTRACLAVVSRSHPARLGPGLASPLPHGTTPSHSSARLLPVLAGPAHALV